LTKSLDTASDALAELRKQGGRDVGQSARAVYKDLGTFVSSARRHSGQLGKALARDFDQAQKKLAKATSTATSKSGGSSRATSKRATASRGTSKRSTAKRAGTSTRAASSRSSGGRAKRTSTTSKRASK
jgi:hypothetical protein